MATPQELIDYVNSENDQLNGMISDKVSMKSQIDAAIAQQQSTIDYFNGQKAQCDVDIANYSANIELNNEIIVILEQQAQEE